MILNGPGAVSKANPVWLASVLHGLGGIPVRTIDELNRFKNPHLWYFEPADVMSYVYASLHGKQIRVPRTEITLELEDMEKERN